MRRSGRLLVFEGKTIDIQCVSYTRAVSLRLDAHNTSLRTRCSHHRSSDSVQKTNMSRPISNSSWTSWTSSGDRHRRAIVGSCKFHSCWYVYSVKMKWIPRRRRIAALTPLAVSQMYFDGPRFEQGRSLCISQFFVVACTNSLRLQLLRVFKNCSL